MRRIIQLCLVAGSAFAVLAGATAVHAQKAGGTLKIYHRGTPPSGSIHEEATNSTLSPYMGVFNNLIMYDQHKRTNSLDTIVPDLATEWAWNDDKTQLTFKLRDGVKWHDGKPFTAKDVQCTWDLLLGNGKAKLRKNPRKSWYGNLDKVTTKGDSEVTFHLKRKQPAFIALLASGYSPVYPCHVPPKKMRTSPVGTGPFKFVQLKQNEFVKFERNKDYWKKDRPYVDAVEWTIIKSRSTRVLAFVAGKFDMTFNVDISIPLLKDVKEQAPDAVCELVTTNVSTNLIVNQDKPPFDNAKVREAMQVWYTSDRPLSSGMPSKSCSWEDRILPSPTVAASVAWPCSVTKNAMSCARAWGSEMPGKAMRVPGRKACGSRRKASRLSRSQTPSAADSAGEYSKSGWRAFGAPTTPHRLGPIP